MTLKLALVKTTLTPLLIRFREISFSSSGHCVSVRFHVATAVDAIWVDFRVTAARCTSLRLTSNLIEADWEAYCHNKSYALAELSVSLTTMADSVCV